MSEDEEDYRPYVMPSKFEHDNNSISVMDMKKITEYAKIKGIKVIEAIEIFKKSKIEMMNELRKLKGIEEDFEEDIDEEQENEIDDEEER